MRSRVETQRILSKSHFNLRHGLMLMEGGSHDGALSLLQQVPKERMSVEGYNAMYFCHFKLERYRYLTLIYNGQAL